jgi:DNA-binding CsgD family transcriptional regulator
MRLRDFIDDCLEAGDEQELFAAFSAFAADQGADLVSYHLISVHLSHIGFDEGFQFHTFPKAWVDRYAQQRYFEIDPIIAACMTEREPFHWFDIDRRRTLTRVQTAFLEDVKAHGIVDGLAVPIFSEKGTSAYFGVGSSQRRLRLTRGDELEIMYACHQVHISFLELRGGVEALSSALSRREVEVLGHVAQGLSNPAIARALNVSESTVETLVRRSFAKLGVSDRISAALKAVGMGLVQI